MATQSLFEKFYTILQKSGLPESRKQYWLDLASNGSLSKEEFDQLDAEMRAHFEELHLAVRVKEAQISDQEKEKAEIETKLLPVMEAYAEAQPTIFAEEKKNLKADYQKVYDELLGELQEVSTSQKEQDIEAIHAFLKNSKPANDNAENEEDETGDIQDAA